MLLAGDYAYKIKKPVDLGFLDFSTLDKRRFYCDEELRLNGRLAPDIYLEVVAVTGSAQAPTLAGHGPAIDYAVKMRRFDQDELLDRRLERGEVDGADIDHLADVVAAFHGAIPAVEPASPLGRPDAVLDPALENFHHLEAHAPAALRTELQTLERWTRDTFETLEPLLRARHDGGFVRECHGDMHLGNMAAPGGELRIFDGIEFSAALRWIDVMSEAAFVVTDLNHRGRPDLAWRFLNRYLEHSGDYEGLMVLAFYRVYRLMVRAKVTAIRMGQLDPNGEDWAADRDELGHYIRQARAASAGPSPALILTRGVSGSGKSWLTQGLLERLPAVRLRSDVERKRLFGLARDADSRSLPGAGIYTPEAGRRTFEHLRVLARTVLRAGLTAIVDATFLEAGHRRPFVELAATEGRPCLVLDVVLEPDTARRRVAERETRGGDPSEAGVEVLERQLADYAPLTAEEGAAVLTVDGASPPAPDDLAATVRSRLEAAS